MPKLTPLQRETLALVNAGKVSEQNCGTGAWRIFGASPGVVGKLRASGYLGWSKVNEREYRFNLTPAGRAALTPSEGVDG